MSKYRTEIIILVVALCARLLMSSILLYQLGPKSLSEGDAITYFNLAHNLIQTKTFSGLPPPSTIPTFSDVPLYPIFLAATLWTRSIGFILLLQALLGALTALIIYRIGILLRLGTGAFFAALTYALEPSILLYTSQIYAETLFTFFFVLAILYILKHSWAKAGVAIAASALTRSIGIFMLPVFIIGYIIGNILNRTPLKTITKNIALGITACLLVITPWVIRNWQIFHSLSLTTHVPHLLITYTIPAYVSWHEHISFPRAQETTLAYFQTRGYQNDTIILEGDPELEKLASQKFSEIVMRDPLGYVASQLRFAPQFFLSSGWNYIWEVIQGYSTKEQGFGEKARATPMRILGSLFWLCITITAGVGAILAWLQKNTLRTPVILFVLLIGSFLFSTGALAHARYRIPVDPLLFLMSGFFVDALFVWKNRLFKSNTPETNISTNQ